MSTIIQETSESDASRGRTITTKSLNTSDIPSSTASRTASPLPGSTALEGKPRPKNIESSEAIRLDQGLRSEGELSEDTSPENPSSYQPDLASDSEQEIGTLDRAKEIAKAEARLNKSNAPEPTKTSWLTIASTLEACFGSEGDASALTAKLREELDLLADNTHGDAEQAQGDHSGEDSALASAPSLMRAFVVHGDICSHAENEALQLASRDIDDVVQEEEPLQVYIEMLDTLDELETKGKDLQDCILGFIKMVEAEEKLSEINTPRSQAINLFKACLPVLQARLSNISMAQELVDGVQENISLTLRMEDLGL